MKTWIIILVAVYLVLKLAEICVANYIRNDSLERLKYKFRDGAMQQVQPGNSSDIVFGRMMVGL